jgi:hypothetical protein
MGLDAVVFCDCVETLNILLEWIASDRHLRTDDQIIDEEERAFERALQAAIARWRSERRT